MPGNQMRTWKVLLLLLPALGALPLASRAQPEAQQPAPPNVVQDFPVKHYQLQLQPDRDQIVDYNRGVDGFQMALKAQTPEEREKNFECGELHLLGALDGPSSFPEATLALAHLYFTRNHQDGRLQPDAYRAAHMFAFLGGKFPLLKSEIATQGAIKSEALTYLGILDLRGRRWAAAKQDFAEAMQTSEDEARKGATDLTGETISLTTRGQRQKMVADWRERVRRLECVNRVGSVIATFYMAQNPADPAPSAPNYRAVLDEINRLLPQDQVQHCEATFNGDLAAIWRFPERTPPPGSRALPFKPFTLATPDWTLTLGSPRPEGVEQVSVADFVRALRIWAGAELAPASPEAPQPAAGLGPREQYNLGARLLRDLLDQEAKGNYQGALGTADRLAELPNVIFEEMKAGPNVSMPIVARQHRIWIRLDHIVDLAEADRLIEGPGVTEDPDVFLERFTLAERYIAANNRAGAERQLRAVLNGTATAADPPSKAYQQKTLDALKPLAAWNLAVLALNLPPGNDNPAIWQELLRTLPPGPYRDTLRFFANLRLAEAYIRTGMPDQTEAALKAAEDIAAMMTGGQPNVPGAPDWLDVYRRHLAQLVLDRNELERYRNGFLTKTSYVGEVRAYEASQIWQSMMPKTDRDYDPILAKLQEALSFANGNAFFRGEVEADIAAIKDFQSKYPAWKKAMDDRAAILPVVKSWNEAAEASHDANAIHLSKATKDQAVAAWKAASEKWSGVLQQVQALPQGLTLPMYGSRVGLGTDAEEAALHVARAQMKVADAYIAGGDREGARTALESARMSLNLPLAAADKQLITVRINHNMAALAPPRRGQPRVSWIYYVEYLTWRHDPPEIPPLYPPRVEYSKPSAELPIITFSVYGYVWAAWVPSSYIIEPKFVPVVRSIMPPKLKVPYWWEIPPLCSPRRITIGRISSINDAHFPLHVDSGTAENRRRKDGSPRGAQDSTRRTPTIVPDRTPHPRKPLPYP